MKKKKYLIGRDFNDYLAKEYEAEDFRRLQKMKDFMDECKKDEFPVLIMGEVVKEEGFIIYNSFNSVSKDRKGRKIRFFKSLRKALAICRNYFNQK